MKPLPKSLVESNKDLPIHSLLFLTNEKLPPTDRAPIKINKFVNN
jgi:hypothetical protein